MKVEKVVKVPGRIIKETTRKTIKIYCDIPNCAKEATLLYGGVNYAKCSICKRDLCKEHLEKDVKDKSLATKVVDRI